jgi:hypothetical protein
VGSLASILRQGLLITVAITDGDWRGAWLLNDQRIFVPGLRFITEVEMSIEDGEAKDKVE